MRVLLSTGGTDGDSRPTLALASALQAAGHRVQVLADGAAAGLAARWDVPFEPLAGDIAAWMGDGRRPDTQTRRVARMVRRHAGTWTRQHLAHLPGADVVVSSSLALPPALAAGRARGVPVVGVSFQPVLPTSAFAHPLLGPARLPAALNRVAGELAVRSLFALYRGPVRAGVRAATGGSRLPRADDWPDLVLGAWSPLLAPAPEDWAPDLVRITGHWRPASAGDPLPDDLAAFLADGEPPVYVGFGSMRLPRPADTLRAVLGGLDGRRAVLADGWSALGDAALPREVVRVGLVPHDRLFPRCAAVLHHGGAGTVHTAARAGVPQAVVPVLADQFFWARRLHVLGLAPAPLPLGRLTGARVRAALAQTPALVPAARAAGEVVAAEDGLTATVRILEGIAG